MSYGQNIDLFKMMKYTEIPEVNLFAFAYRLFHEGFSPINGAPCIKAPH